MHFRMLEIKKKIKNNNNNEGGGRTQIMLCSVKKKQFYGLKKLNPRKIVFFPLKIMDA